MAVDITSNRLTNPQWAPFTYALAFFNEDLIRSDRSQTRRNLASQNQVPTPEEIRLQCQLLQANWDDREKQIRQLRAQMAVQFGVCRNC